MKKYSIIIGSPVAYDYLIADIVIKDKYIARVQMEAGKEKMLLEFHDDALSENVELDVFVRAIEEAKELLLK